MIYPIYTYGEDFLRKKVSELKFNDNDISSLIFDMFETMYAAKGAGLAANQIGVDKQIIIIEEELREGEIFKGVFINPKIINYSGYLYEMGEGCLSFPEIEAKIVRPLNVDVEWYDENNAFHKQTFSGIQSRILQHEIDHLNGILFIDRMRPEDKMKIFMKLEDIKDKKIITNYLIK